MKNILTIAVCLSILFLFRHSLITYANEFYLLNFSPVAGTGGAMTNVVENNSIGGGLSFEYQTNYTVKGKRYERSFLSSPEPLDLQTGDAVAVLYAVTRPEISTLTIAGFNWKSFVWSLCALAVIVVFLIGALVGLVRKKDSKLTFPQRPSA